HRTLSTSPLFPYTTLFRSHVTLMEDDGTSWSAPITMDSTWREQSVPLSAFTIGRGVLLPEGFPGEWNYWVGPASGRGGPGDRPRSEEHTSELQSRRDLVCR